MKIAWLKITRRGQRYKMELMILLSITAARLALCAQRLEVRAESAAHAAANEMGRCEMAIDGIERLDRYTPAAYSPRAWRGRQSH